jgi:DNA-binding MarR family transcriptional regulator
MSRHAQVFLAITRDPSLRMREIAEHLGYTERMVQNLVRDLEAEGYLTHIRVGRRNQYSVCTSRLMRHPLVRHNEVSALLELLS